MIITTNTHNTSVAWVTLDEPPVNSLGHALRTRIAAGLDAANANPGVKAIVLIGAGKAFSGGADVREFGTSLSGAEPGVRTLIEIIEASTKPVIAAIGGLALGGGLELALACHFRIAAHGTTLALPEVKLGLLPGAGGTQRLPRLIGVEAALNMIVSGEMLPAEHFKGTALIDELVNGDLRQGAQAFAEKVIAEGKPLALARHRKLDYPNADGFFQHARRTLAQKNRFLLAPLKCVDAVAAAVGKPYDESLERQLFAELMGSAPSRALRHRFQAERACAKITDVPSEVQPRPIHKVGVIGAGTMGVGIAMALLDAGIPVVLLETRQDALDRGLATLRKNYEASVKKGKLDDAGLAQRMSQLQGELDYQALAGVDLAIEAVFEDLGVKQTVFEQMDLVMKPGAILASNTSTLDLDRIAGFTRRPQDVVGLHFFSPANIMRLLEVVRGRLTGLDVLVSVMHLARRINKTAVVSGVCDGFIGNRMFGHYTREAGLLVEEGATPQQVDRALENWGMAMGPFRMGDLAGLDIVHAVRKRHYAEHPEWKFPRFLDRLCQQERLGQKTGSGWYRYAAGQREALPDGEVARMLDEYRSELGVQPKKFSDAQIVERCIYAVVNEGARLLDEGIAQRASDVDMVALTGYAFPAHRGGPLFYAEEIGLYGVLRAIRKLRAETGDVFWNPAPLLTRLVETRESFKTVGSR